MHQSIIARVACAAMVPLAVAMGWLIHAFMYELEAQSPLLYMGFGATVILMVWSVWDLTDGD